jgi:hypothetical protein
MQNHNLKNAFTRLVEATGDDLCREAKNHLHQTLMLHANETAQYGASIQHDQFMLMHESLYTFFDELDSLFAEDLAKK